MKKLFILSMACALFASCDNTDTEDTISPENFPVATANYTGSASVTEADGSTSIDISLSKPVNNGTSFTVEQIGGTAVAGVDYTTAGIAIPAFTQSGTIVVNLIDNPFPQADRTLTLLVSNAEFGEAILNPSSNFPYTVNLTITDVNSTDGVTVGFKWNEDQASDLDITVINSSGAELRFAATSSNPEQGVLVLNTDPDDTYYVDMQPYDFTEAQIDFNFGISKPNGEVVEFSGTFDTDNLGSYGSDESPVLGTAYRLVKIVKSGSNYTITQLF